ncbi:MAG: DoxX family protein [Bacteroidota bacterium]
MNTTVWFIQGLLTLAFFMAGAMKLIMPKERLGKILPWAKEYSSGMVRFIGLSELLGAVGLTLPLYIGIVPVLTPWAATGLCLVMLLAIMHHLRRSEFKEILINAALFVLSAVVAYYRCRY